MYNHYLFTADLMVLPYQVDRYISRTSGILAEAICAVFRPLPLRGPGWPIRSAGMVRVSSTKHWILMEPLGRYAMLYPRSRLCKYAPPTAVVHTSTFITHRDLQNSFVESGLQTFRIDADTRDEIRQFDLDGNIPAWIRHPVCGDANGGPTEDGDAQARLENTVAIWSAQRDSSSAVRAG